MKNFTSNSQKIGELGEDVACKFLMKHGFSVLERNYTKKWGEIDIITRKEDKIYFIEVKSKKVESIDYVNRFLEGPDRETSRPEDNMHPWKLKRLSRTIQTYLIHKRIGNTPWQFDLLVVYLDTNKRLARVKVVENVIL
jgi:putative endonuclease